MQQIHLDFIRSYEKLMNNLTQTNVKQFYKDWNLFFRHKGYFDVTLQSTIGIAACIMQKIKNSK